MSSSRPSHLGTCNLHHLSTLHIHSQEEEAGYEEGVLGLELDAVGVVVDHDDRVRVPVEAGQVLAVGVMG